ncbi:MAG: hypothetical protein U9Q07_04685, partial [Planctomycetota bacterium]|nr:hypothetical protein [Planctomycetota bacterium]
YGWSGIVRPAKSGYRFEPPALNYPRVGENLTNQDYAARLESSDAEGPGLYGSGGSRSRSGRRGSTPGMDMMYAPSGSPPRGRSSSRFRPAIPSGAVGRKVLVIPAGEINAKELAETVEDMHVMSHILDEGFKAPRRIQGLFTDLGDFFGRDSRGAEATYLQGVGVLFLMEVNFAFSPPPKKQAQEPTETTKAADSTWQKARREVLSPGMGQEDLADDYDNQMVEELKRELIGAFKHASNIRNVKPDEWIILTVIGGQRQFGMGGMTGGGMGGMGGMSGGMGGSMGMGMGMGGGMSGYSSGGGYATSGYGGAGGMMMGGMASGMGNVYGSMSPSHNTTAFSASTVMTIRAKKTDVDGFARGDLDFEQFQEKVTILTY